MDEVTQFGGTYYDMGCRSKAVSTNIINIVPVNLHIFNYFIKKKSK